MNSFGAKGELRVDGESYDIYRLRSLEPKANVSRLPYSLQILLENLLRVEDGAGGTTAAVEAVAAWNPHAEPSREIAFTPARVILQDFTGVPCVVDLAAMRDAMADLGGKPEKINPLQPVELVIDHSVQVDAYGSEAAININRDMEYGRNLERYRFLKWGQKALANFKVVPPNTGIVHQVNLEHLARVAFVAKTATNRNLLYPDTLVGTDSHTTMINGLGVLGWGVGGIEAEAAMLGQPISMLVPQVIGFRLTGALPEGSTATDLVLTVTEMLREHGVVGKFVEFFGEGLSKLPLADRATIGNMAPEFGATCAMFPVDDETLRYLRLTGRPEAVIHLVEAYYKEQGLFHEPGQPKSEYSGELSLDLSTVVPSIAGPRRPQDRCLLSEARKSFFAAFGEKHAKSGAPARSAPSGVATALWEAPGQAEQRANASADKLTDGSIVIAAITSCTNTSNPSVMVAAGLVAQKAVALGLYPKPWVKTSLAPGSRVAADILKSADLLRSLEQVGFYIVGFGCTTCIGNSGPLPAEISREVNERGLAVVSVLSGNRNFEGRINPDVKASYLMSPPLVVAYALAGTIDIDLLKDPIGIGTDGKAVFLKDIWPSNREVAETVAQAARSELYKENYADVFSGDEKWKELSIEDSERFAWEPDSTYIKRPPYFEHMKKSAPAQVSPLHGMNVLAILGDSVTTDHISPAGSIKRNSPAGEYLSAHGVEPLMFNSYGSRRGNHEVMVRGTFANVRLRNKLAPGTEGGFTTYLPTGEVMTIYDAATKYRKSNTPLLVIAGKEYGSGSSRDWAAKGTMMLGVKVVLAESFERIHRSNLIGMGVLPLEFAELQSAESLRITGKETFELTGLQEAVVQRFKEGTHLQMTMVSPHGIAKAFPVKVRIDTPRELDYYLNGGILQFVLRKLAT